MRVIFFSRSLEMGGAERQLVYLANSLAERGHDIGVISMYKGGRFKDDDLSSNITFWSLNKTGRWHLIEPLLKFVRIIRTFNPDIVHGYGTVPNLLIVCLKRILQRSQCVWGVRSSYLDLDDYDWSARVLAYFEGPLSRFADLIIVNSSAGFVYAEKRGFCVKKLRLVENGVDLATFRPDLSHRKKIRSILGLEDGVILVGFVGRPDPVKDHRNFVESMAIAISEVSVPIRAISIGCDPSAEIRDLKRFVENQDIAEYFVWESAKKNIAEWLNGIDILVSSSYGEGFSNVITEAMACAVPCVVTDVGESARIVDKCGVIVPPRNPSALAAGIAKLARMEKTERDEIGNAGRESIMKRFSINRLSHKSEKLFREILN